MDLINNLSFNTKGYSMDNMALHAQAIKLGAL